MQVTIANAIQWRYTVWLCVFGVLGLIPFATVRAHNNPPVAKSVGAHPYSQDHFLPLLSRQEHEGAGW